MENNKATVLLRWGKDLACLEFLKAAYKNLEKNL